jgi:rhodanese-related sulfurtransferase
MGESENSETLDAQRGATQQVDLERVAPRGEPMRVPQPLAEQPGRVVVDVTWGTIQPIRLHPRIETVGELEVIEALRAGLPVFDTRRPASFAAGTIPGARPLSHVDLEERLRGLRERELEQRHGGPALGARGDPRLPELAAEVPAILFCNGPQCAATPKAVRILLAHGHPAELLRYYRGGIHDWVTLGLPLVPGAVPSQRPDPAAEGAGAEAA